MKVIVGLGNPGETYRRSRHNIGFEVIDRLAEDNRIAISHRRLMAQYGKGVMHSESVLRNNPEETAKVLHDGWLRTGALGHMNADGFFTITARKKDLILVSGFNVYPNEIESVVAAHPGVLECGVVGVPMPHRVRR